MGVALPRAVPLENRAAPREGLERFGVPLGVLREGFGVPPAAAHREKLTG